MTDDAKKARGLETLAIRDTMATEGGRHFMWRMLEQSGVFTDTFSENPILHARNAGMRAHGLWLVEELKEAAFGSYQKMTEEHTDG